MADPTRFLSLDEVLLVLADLKRRQKRSACSRLNMMVFTFSACCGLRRTEIAKLRFENLVLAGPRPVVIVPKEITKGQKEKRRTRRVPLWWDSATTDRIRDWVRFRREMGARPGDVVLCGVCQANRGKPLTGPMVAKHWKTAIRILGPERVRQLSVHCGRHSFASLSFDAGHSAVEVQEALGHSSVSTTSIYLHAVPKDLPDIFAPRDEAA